MSFATDPCTVRRPRCAALLAGLLLVVAVAGCSQAARDGIAPSAAVQEVAPMEPEAGAASESGGADASQSAGDAGGAAAGAAVARKLVFTGRMRLEVEDAVAESDAAQAWAEERGGFAERVEVSDDGSGPTVSATFRVPSDSFDELRRHLRGRARQVHEDSKQRVDVTARYADLEARLANLEAAEAELREMLASSRENAGTTEDVLRIHAEMTRVRGEADALRAERDALGEQVAFSTLEVWFQPVAGEPVTVGRLWRPGDTARRAWVDLTRGMSGLLDTLIYLAIAVLPILVVLLAILAVVVWAFAAFVRRMRRSAR